MKKSLFGAIAISLLLFASITLADIPRKISVQGLLSDPVSGKALSVSSVNLTFRFYDQYTGGSIIGSPIVMNNVPLDDGFFNVELSPSLEFDEPYYINLSVWNNTLGWVYLSPRINMTSVAYAFSATRLYTSGNYYVVPEDISKLNQINASTICLDTCQSSWPSGIDGSGAANKVVFWTDSDTLSYNNNFHWDNTNKRLGIGTSGPDSNVGLDVQNSEPVGNTGSIITNTYFFRNTGGVLAAPPSMDGWINMDGDNMYLNLRRDTAGSGIHFLIPGGLSAVNRMSIMEDGGIRVGSEFAANIPNSCGGNWITNADMALWTADSTGGCGDEAYIAHYIRSGEATTLEIGNQNDADDHIALMPSGNVGIGTTNPTAKLDVNGNIKVIGTVDGYDISLYGQYFIGSAGTSGQVWKSDGSGTGYWGTDNTLSQGTVESYIANDVSTNYIPRNDGTKLVTGSIYDNNAIVGIGGTGDSGYKLTVNGGTTREGIWGISSGTNKAGIVGSGWGTGGNGVLGYGEGCDFYANGPGTNYCSPSSIRWKENIKPIDNALDKVLKLRGVYFDWDEEHGGEHDIGMIAEEVGEIFPEVVVYEGDSKYTRSMDYSKITTVLVEAIKEQQKQIEILKYEIKSLKQVCN